MREIRSPLDGILSPFAAKPPPALSGAATLAAGEAEAFALDFTDSSIFVKDTGTPANDIDQSGLFNAAGEAIGPQSRLTYTNPTPKQVLQSDGLLKFGAHNLYVNSEAPADQSVTLINGASYVMTITGSVSITVSGAATGTYTTGDNAFTAASGTLTCGSTSGSGTVHLRRTPSVSAYVKTGASAVYALPIDHDTSGNQIGVLIEPQATNLAVYSNDLTQAAWTPTNITPAKTATGPDGVASSSTTLTATAGNATILQSITSASSARITSCYIKRRTGTGTIEMTQDNGSNWSSVTVTANWSRVEIAAATITNPVVGLRIVTSGDEIDVAYFQHETGSIVTSAIATPANATVTRNADDITEATSAMPYDATAGAWYIQAIVENTPTDTYLLDATSGERMLMYVAGASNAINYGIQASSSFGVLGAGSGSITDGAAFRAAMSVTANDFAAVLDGTVDLTDASVTVSNPTIFYFGQFFGSASQLNGHIKQVMYLPRRVSNADLQTLTSTGALP